MRRSGTRLEPARTDGQAPWLVWLIAALVVALSGCAVTGPAHLESATGLVAPSGQILLPPCPASAGCEEGFVVGDSSYGISCHGVDPTAVEDATVARGTGQYEEARAIDKIPPHLWLAVRGDVPCLPGEGESPLYEWYLATGDPTPADLEEWGERVSRITLPADP